MLFLRSKTFKSLLKAPVWSHGHSFSMFHDVSCFLPVDKLRARAPWLLSALRTLATAPEASAS